MSGLGGKLRGAFAGFAGIAGVTMAFRRMKESLVWADDLADLTQKLNENAEVLQRVDFAAQRAASIGVDQVAKAMLRLEDSLGDLESARVADSLDRIGLSAESLVGLPLDEKLLALSESFQEARRTGVGVADMQELMGRSAQELIPLLNLEGDALRALFDDARTLTDAQVQAMARANDAIDGFWDNSKIAFGGFVANLQEGLAMLKDFSRELSFSDVTAGRNERRLADQEAAAARAEARAEASAALERQRAAEGGKADEEAARKAEERDRERLERIKEALEADEIELLPSDEKIEALRRKLSEVVEGSLGNFPLFTRGLGGMSDEEKLRALAESREANGDLPLSGVNSAAEAYGWLEELREIKGQIAAEEKLMAEEKAAAEEERLSRLEAARKAAAASEMDLLSPEEQARRLRDRLSRSLGRRVSGADDIDAGLDALRRRVERARAQGATDAEAAALERLDAAQRQAAEFGSLASGLAEGAAPEGGEMGSVAGLFAQVFGRDREVDHLREIREETRREREVLDAILERMDVPDEVFPVIEP